MLKKRIKCLESDLKSMIREGDSMSSYMLNLRFIKYVIIILMYNSIVSILCHSENNIIMQIYICDIVTNYWLQQI